MSTEEKREWIMVGSSRVPFPYFLLIEEIYHDTWKYSTVISFGYVCGYGPTAQIIPSI